MMEQLKVLKRIKDLREEQALRRVNEKRREIAEAEAAVSAARNAVHESEITLPAREDAVFNPIIKKVVGFDDVEQAKLDVQDLQKLHSKLVDNAERAKHVRDRIQKQLDDAVAAHRKAIAEQDKYVVLAEEATSELRVQIEHQEEIELEDLMISRRSGLDD